MTRKAKAVVCRELNQPVVVEEITLDAPKRGEVMVKIICAPMPEVDVMSHQRTIPIGF